MRCICRWYRVSTVVVLAFSLAWASAGCADEDRAGSPTSVEATRELVPPSYTRTWDRQPATTVIGAVEDERVAMINEAVAFWNNEFEQLGSGLRLGSVSVVPGAPRAGDMVTMSEAALAGGCRIARHRVHDEGETTSTVDNVCSDSHVRMCSNAHTMHVNGTCRWHFREL